MNLDLPSFLNTPSSRKYKSLKSSAVGNVFIPN